MSAPSSRSTLFEQQIPDRLSAVGPGWHPILLRLHEQLLALAPDYRLEELTPKLGGLRIYAADRFDDHGEFDGDWADLAGRLAEAAELEAERTCESCGDPGRTRFHGDQHGTWIKTLCDNCRAAPQSAEPRRDSS